MARRVLDARRGEALPREASFPRRHARADAVLLHGAAHGLADVCNAAATYGVRSVPELVLLGPDDRAQLGGDWGPLLRGGAVDPEDVLEGGDEWLRTAVGTAKLREVIERYSLERFELSSPNGLAREIPFVRPALCTAAFIAQVLPPPTAGDFATRKLVRLMVLVRGLTVRPDAQQAGAAALVRSTARSVWTRPD